MRQYGFSFKTRVVAPGDRGFSLRPLHTIVLCGVEHMRYQPNERMNVREPELMVSVQVLSLSIIYSLVF